MPATAAILRLNMLTGIDIPVNGTDILTNANVSTPHAIQDKADLIGFFDLDST